MSVCFSPFGVFRIITTGEDTYRLLTPDSHQLSQMCMNQCLCVLGYECVTQYRDLKRWESVMLKEALLCMMCKLLYDLDVYE